MSVQDAFEVTGAAAGVISLIWLIVTQLFGSYEARTIRQVLTQQAETISDAVRRLERIAENR
jgi:hypothetical protein